jgi:hypothetical protein
MDPIDIFDYLASNFNDVIVEDDVIKFVYVWGAKVRRQMDICIELV